MTLRNVPLDLYQDLRWRATAHHRNVKAEVIALLQASFRRAKRVDVEKQIAEARELRNKFKGNTPEQRASARPAQAEDRFSVRSTKRR